jgi:hypothetical protein
MQACDCPLESPASHIMTVVRRVAGAPYIRIQQSKLDHTDKPVR